MRDGREQPLIPRYFDLLVFLVERRGEAVHRRDIFDRIWSDVVVSDSALSQAVWTIRRVLGDDSRESRFVRTVSRHGYRFVFADVVEEEDEGEWPVADGASPDPAGGRSQPYEPLLERVTRVAASASEEEISARQPNCCTPWALSEALALWHPPSPRVRASAATGYALGRGGGRPGADSRRAPAPFLDDA